ncbi:MAG: FAD-dependent oxidoreductase [Pseudomonadota bacterium]
MSKRLLLVGGGHAHALVLLDFARRPEPALDVVLIAGEPSAPYSGMLPGLVAGRFSRDACHIDLPRLARAAGARVIAARVASIDVVAREAWLEDGGREAFDLLSLNVGITPDLGGIAGAAEHGIAVKPISAFHPKWATVKAAADRGRLPSLAIIGGGAAGFELAISAREALGSATAICLIAGGTLLAGLGARVTALGRRALERAHVELVEDDAATAVTPEGAVLASGRSVGAATVLVTTGAAPAPWYSGTALPLSPNGYLAARPTLQLDGLDHVLGAGDGIDVIAHPRPKAGVIAVRQGPALARNLRRLARGEAPLPFVPQRRWLQLLTSGPDRAIALWGGLAQEGRWALKLKDRIDLGFMRAFERV